MTISDLFKVDRMKLFKNHIENIFAPFFRMDFEHSPHLKDQFLDISAMLFSDGGITLTSDHVDVETWKNKDNVFITFLTSKVLSGPERGVVVVTYRIPVILECTAELLTAETLTWAHFSKHTGGRLNNTIFISDKSTEVEEPWYSVFN